MAEVDLIEEGNDRIGIAASEDVYDYECDDDDENDDEEPPPTLFKLSGVDSNLGISVLEDALTNILSIPTTLLETEYNGEEGTILFCCFPNDTDEDGNPIASLHNDEFILKTIGDCFHGPTKNSSSLSLVNVLFKDAANASITIVDQEEDETDEFVEYITEEEAYQLWLEEGGNHDGGSQDNLVSSPDGELVKPAHFAASRRDLDPPQPTYCGEEEKKSETERKGSIPSSTTPKPPMATATTRQLQRDPGLFHFDNVPRVHYSEALDGRSIDESRTQSSSNRSSTSWKENFGSQPIVFYGLGRATTTTSSNLSAATSSSNHLHEDLLQFQKALRETIRRQGTDTIVRTGNRETLVKNGFHNSKPATLTEAAGNLATTLLEDNGGSDDDGEPCQTIDGTIVFNPIHEMPSEFRTEDVLGRWMNADGTADRVFPNQLWNRVLAPNSNGDDDDYGPKFTLCIANEGFGIGMHKHGPALFFLTEGRKKWYLSHPGPIDERIAASATATKSPTHPDFYRELSTHKCVQEPGELLFVPNLWYHEIYNLASPTIGIQALADELPVSETPSC